MALFAANSIGTKVTFPSAQFVEDYNEYYLYKKDILITPLIGVNGSTPAYKIWFLPGQKKKLLNKIKEDIYTELSQIAEENSHIISDYKINNDLKRIYIYIYKNKDLPQNFDWEETIELKVSLYHQFLRGEENTELENIINYIEIE